MDIKTRFSIGQKLFTINKTTLKMMEFTVGAISVWVDDNTSICYYPIQERKEKGVIYTDSYREDVCFGSESELLTHITKK